MKAFIFAFTILCIILPAGALLYIIFSLVKWNKSKKASDEVLRDIMLEYEIKAEKKKQDSEEKK
ncbi:MAG: hypothetical protein ACI4JM_08700 [Oscillospiraceae bacterium]